LKILAKKVFFLDRVGKTNFTTFPPVEKFWKNTLVAPLEKILQTPMLDLIPDASLTSIGLDQDYNESFGFGSGL